jgi:hypothetical protein
MPPRAGTVRRERCRGVNEHGEVRRVERTERTVDRDANQALWARFADVQGRYLRMRDGLADL